MAVFGRWRQKQLCVRVQTGSAHRRAVREYVSCPRIFGWMIEKFGTAQAEIYATALSSTIDALRAGPLTAGVRKRDDVAKGLRSLQVRVKRRGGRHQVYFRVAERAREIVVVRILHDAMEPARPHRAQPTEFGDRIHIPAK